MDFGLSQDQVLFQDTLRRFLAEQCPTARVRAIMESDSGHDAELWARLADLGVPGLVVPAAYGGAGLELLDLALAAQELGYACTPGPFLATSLFTLALLQAGSEEQKSHWLPRLVRGEAIGSLALAEAEAQWDPRHVTTRFETGKLQGEKTFVPYANVADAMVVVAQGDSGPAFFLAQRGAPGMDVRDLQVVDMTRRVQHVRFQNTPAEPLPGPSAAVQRVLDAGYVLVAADAFGGCQRCLDMSVNYAKTREQFGQVIGAFQAVKHQLANMACELEPALSFLWYAAHAFDHLPDQAERHAAMVKPLMTDLFDRFTRDSIELHGGIGFSWEFDLHLWFRRAVFDRAFLGDASYHRNRAAELAGW